MSCHQPINITPTTSTTPKHFNTGRHLPSYGDAEGRCSDRGASNIPRRNTVWIDRRTSLYMPIGLERGLSPRVPISGTVGEQEVYCAGSPEGGTTRTRRGSALPTQQPTVAEIGSDHISRSPRRSSWRSGKSQSVIIGTTRCPRSASTPRKGWENTRTVRGPLWPRSDSLPSHNAGLAEPPRLPSHTKPPKPASNYPPRSDSLLGYHRRQAADMRSLPHHPEPLESDSGNLLTRGPPTVAASCSTCQSPNLFLEFTRSSNGLGRSETHPRFRRRFSRRSRKSRSEDCSLERGDRTWTPWKGLRCLVEMMRQGCDRARASLRLEQLSMPVEHCDQETSSSEQRGQPRILSLRTGGSEHVEMGMARPSSCIEPYACAGPWRRTAAAGVKMQRVATPVPKAACTVCLSFACAAPCSRGSTDNTPMPYLSSPSCSPPCYCIICAQPVHPHQNGGVTLKRQQHGLEMGQAEPDHGCHCRQRRTAGTSAILLQTQHGREDNVGRPLAESMDSYSREPGKAQQGYSEKQSKQLQTHTSAITISATGDFVKGVFPCGEESRLGKSCFGQLESQPRRRRSGFTDGNSCEFESWCSAPAITGRGIGDRDPRSPYVHGKRASLQAPERRSISTPRRKPPVRSTSHLPGLQAIRRPHTSQLSLEANLLHSTSSSPQLSTSGSPPSGLSQEGLSCVPASSSLGSFEQRLESVNCGDLGLAVVPGSLRDSARASGSPNSYPFRKQASPTDRLRLLDYRKGAKGHTRKYSWAGKDKEEEEDCGLEFGPVVSPPARMQPSAVAKAETGVAGELRAPKPPERSESLYSGHAMTWKTHSQIPANRGARPLPPLPKLKEERPKPSHRSDNRKRSGGGKGFWDQFRTHGLGQAASLSGSTSLSNSLKFFPPPMVLRLAGSQRRSVWLPWQRISDQTAKARARGPNRLLDVPASQSLSSVHLSSASHGREEGRKYPRETFLVSGPSLGELDSRLNAEPKEPPRRSQTVPNLVDLQKKSKGQARRTLASQLRRNGEIVRKLPSSKPGTTLFLESEMVKRSGDDEGQEQDESKMLGRIDERRPSCRHRQLMGLHRSHSDVCGSAMALTMPGGHERSPDHSLTAAPCETPELPTTRRKSKRIPNVMLVVEGGENEDDEDEEDGEGDGIPAHGLSSLPASTGGSVSSVGGHDVYVSQPLRASTRQEAPRIGLSASLDSLFVSRNETHASLTPEQSSHPRHSKQQREEPQQDLKYLPVNSARRDTSLAFSPSMPVLTTRSPPSSSNSDSNFHANPNVTTQPITQPEFRSTTAEPLGPTSGIRVSHKGGTLDVAGGRSIGDHDACLLTSVQNSVNRSHSMHELQQRLQFDEHDMVFKRGLVLQEIVQTEEDYVRDLNNLNKHFFKNLPLVTCLILNEIQILMCNIAEVIAFQNRFFALLRDTFDVGRQTESHKGSPRIGAVFTFLAENLHVYAPYCLLHEIAMDIIKDHSENAEMTKFLKATCDALNQGKRRLQIKDYLIKPIQRITKYPLLLSQLIRYVPSIDDDFVPLKSAIELLRDALSAVDQRKLEWQRKRNSQKLWSRLGDHLAQAENWELNPADCGTMIFGSHLSLISYEQPQQVRSYGCFIFDAGYIIAVKARKRYQLKWWWKLVDESGQLWDLIDFEDENCWMLRSRDEEAQMFEFCSDDGSKQHWIDRISEFLGGPVMRNRRGDAKETCDHHRRASSQEDRDADYENAFPHEVQGSQQVPVPMAQSGRRVGYDFRRKDEQDRKFSELLGSAAYFSPTYNSNGGRLGMAPVPSALPASVRPESRVASTALSVDLALPSSPRLSTHFVSSDAIDRRLGCNPAMSNWERDPQPKFGKRRPYCQSYDDLLWEYEHAKATSETETGTLLRLIRKLGGGHSRGKSSLPQFIVESTVA